MAEQNEIQLDFHLGQEELKKQAVTGVDLELNQMMYQDESDLEQKREITHFLKHDQEKVQVTQEIKLTVNGSEKVQKLKQHQNVETEKGLEKLSENLIHETEIEILTEIMIHKETLAYCKQHSYQHRFSLYNQDTYILFEKDYNQVKHIWKF